VRRLPRRARAAARLGSRRSQARARAGETTRRSLSSCRRKRRRGPRQTRHRQAAHQSSQPPARTAIRPTGRSPRSQAPRRSRSLRCPAAALATRRARTRTRPPRGRKQDDSTPWNLRLGAPGHAISIDPSNWSLEAARVVSSACRARGTSSDTCESFRGVARSTARGLCPG
jgi:hypothetical protein